MNTAKLLKLAPTLILIAFLAYASYSLNESIPTRGSGQSEMAKGLDMVEDMLASGSATAERLIGEFRDPFQVSHASSPPADASQSQPGLPTESPTDPLADLVQGMTLEATFFQGRDQIAIIDGRIYSKGQALRFRNDSGDPSSRLVMTVVLPSKVILRGNNRNYVLSYPDQLGKRPPHRHRAWPGLRRRRCWIPPASSPCSRSCSIHRSAHWVRASSESRL